MNLLKEITSQFSKFSKDAGLILGFLIICSGIVYRIKEVINSNILLLVVALGVFIIALRVSFKIRNAQKNLMGQASYIYTPETRKRAKVSIWISLVLLLITLITTICLLLNELSGKNRQKNLELRKSEMTLKKIGVVISRFNSSTNDPFTNELRELINSNKEVKRGDSIEAVFHHKFLATMPDNAQDTLDAIFKNRFERGILVLGERDKDVYSGSKVFKCILYINNLKNLLVDSTQIDLEKSDEKTIYIQNPSIIDLGYDSQAQDIADFILGLLHYNAKQKNSAEFYLKKAILASGDNPATKKFIAQCHLYLGDLYLSNGEFEKAATEYERGIELDPANAHLHYNRAAIYLSKKDTLNAYSEYLEANSIDKKLQIPFKKPHEIQLIEQKDETKGNSMPTINLAGKMVSASNKTVVSDIPIICGDTIFIDNSNLKARKLLGYLSFFYTKITNYFVDSKLRILHYRGYKLIQIGNVNPIHHSNGSYLTSITDFCGNKWDVDTAGRIFAGQKIIGTIRGSTLQELNKQKPQIGNSKIGTNQKNTKLLQTSKRKLDESFPQTCPDSIPRLISKKEKQYKYIYQLFFGDNHNITYFIDSRYRLILQKGNTYEYVGDAYKVRAHDGSTTITLIDFCKNDWVSDTNGIVYHYQSIRKKVGVIIPLN